MLNNAEIIKNPLDGESYLVVPLSEEKNPELGIIKIEVLDKYDLDDDKSNKWDIVYQLFLDEKYKKEED
jgi:hypothetical protein